MRTINPESPFDDMGVIEPKPSRSGWRYVRVAAWAVGAVIAAIIASAVFLSWVGVLSIALADT
jgi:hypothetical protein